jgi:hypothetical protein
MANSKLNNTAITANTNSTARQSVKPYNPEKDKVKIVKGDMFDVKGRIGMNNHTAFSSTVQSPKDAKNGAENNAKDTNLDYSDPDRVLGQVRYEKTKNLLLQWNPFVI